MSVITYKCPNCGGDLQFHPETQKFNCEYCRSDFTETEVEKPDAENPADLSTGTEQSAGDGQTAVVYHCPSCGAEIITDETTTATFCYYCHNPVVLAGRMQGDYHPDYVLPFAIDRQKALTIFNQWIGKKKYVPKAFYSEDQIEKLSGVYFPYWLYSCQVDGALDVQATKLRTWTTGNVQYTETRQFDVIREGQMNIDHVTRNALKKANRQLVEGVLPFEMEKLTPFQMSYLSGFLAEKRDMEQKDFANQVEKEVQDFAAADLRSQVSGYDSVKIRSQKADIRKPVWQYALMPVWTLTYKDTKTDKIYYFACNGQTGKICGQLPVDYRRLMGLFGAIFAPLFIALMIVGYFL